MTWSPLNPNTVVWISAGRPAARPLATRYVASPRTANLSANWHQTSSVPWAAGPRGPGKSWWPFSVNDWIAVGAGPVAIAAAVTPKAAREPATTPHMSDLARLKVTASTRLTVGPSLSYARPLGVSAAHRPM